MEHFIPLRLDLREGLRYDIIVARVKQKNFAISLWEISVRHGGFCFKKMGIESPAKGTCKPDELEY